MSIAFCCVRQCSTRPFVAGSIPQSWSVWAARSSQSVAQNRQYSSGIARDAKKRLQRRTEKSKRVAEPPSRGVIQELQRTHSQEPKVDYTKKPPQSTRTKAITPEKVAHVSSPVASKPQVPSPPKRQLPLPSNQQSPSPNEAFRELKAKRPTIAPILQLLLSNNAPYIYKAPAQRGIVVVVALASAFCVGAGLLFASIGTGSLPAGTSQIVTRSYLIVAGFFLLVTAFLARTPRKFIKSIKVVEQDHKIRFDVLVKPYLYIPGKARTVMVDPLKFIASPTISPTVVNYERRLAYQKFNEPGPRAGGVQHAKYKFGRSFGRIFESIAVGLMRDGLVGVEEKGGKHIGRLDARGWFPNAAGAGQGSLLDRLSNLNR